VIKEPIFPAIITEIKVGANSSITDCLVAKPIRYLGINGFVRFSGLNCYNPTNKERDEGYD
jgi:hypothetical protein